MSFQSSMLQFLREVESASKKMCMTRLRSKLFAMRALADTRWKDTVCTIIYPTYRQSQAAEVQVGPSTYDRIDMIRVRSYS